MSGFKLMIPMMCIYLAASVQTIAAADDTLLIHYTFDSDGGDLVEDQSAYGHDGNPRKTQFMESVDGRDGVLRFDGESSYLSCGDSETQRFGGDMSLEMWARANGPTDSSGTLFGWGNIFNVYGPETPMVEYATGDDKMRTYLEKGKQLLSDRWSHIALVVEYPRIRLYRDGDLVRDIYMPFPAVRKDAAAKTIAQKCPIDLDEFRLYRRALTEAEIAAHARGEDAPAPAQDELLVEPHWYEDIVSLRLSCKGTDYRGHTAQMTLLAGDSAELVEPQSAELTESYDGSGRYVAAVAFPLAALQDKSLDARAQLLDSNGKHVKTIYQHAYLAKPEWVDNKLGYSNEVLAPWTPVETDTHQNGTVELRVWGRTHVFGSTLFPERIKTRDAEILAAPITLTGQADGEDLSWTDSRVKLLQASEIAALLEQIGKNKHLTLKIKTSVEYDGYMIFDCQLEAQGEVTLEQLTLDIPLHSRHATLCFGSDVYPEKKDPEVIPMSVLHMGAVDGDLSFQFGPSVWLGDELRGLSWQAESNEDWRYADPQKAIEILPREDKTIFRAHLVDIPTRLAAGESLHYKFALQATPVKPLLRDAWDLRILRSDPYVGLSGDNPDLNLPDRYIKIDHVKKDRIYSEFVEELNLMEDGPGRMPALQYYAETGARHLWINPHDNWPWPWPADKQFGSELKRLINAAHAHGLKIYPYLIHERMPTNVPEFDIHGIHMVNRPIKPYNGVVGFCAKSKASQDAIIYNLVRRLDAYGDDGIYLDGTGVHMKSCQNLAHGCGYHAKPGSVHLEGAVAFDQTDRGTGDEVGPIHPTYAVFSDREFIRRIYAVIKERRPDGVMDVHSWHYNSGGLAYADILWTGEQWWHLRGKGVKYAAAELTLDTFRTAFTGIQFGIAAETLPYRLVGNGQTNSQVAATSLLHDIPVRIRTQDTEYFDIMTKLWKVREQFGAKKAEKLFYWDNAEYVKVAPEKSYATLLKHPSNGVLAFISNLRRDAATVAVQFDLNKLALGNQDLEVINVLTDEPVAMTEAGNLSVPLGSEEWVYVWLRPTR